MLVPITAEKIATMSVEQRENLYRNCMKKIENEEAVRLVDLIVGSGLPFRKRKEIAHGDPEMRTIELVVNARSNEALLLDAVAAGQAPLAVLEPLIVRELGPRYSGANGGTIAAGYLIAKRLYALGHEKMPSQRMPAGSVAKTAATFRKSKVKN
ncbi:hypothetical protein [Aureimonas leprariae]|uniref:Uncharacterized protein n=1 Tax=Plantimonas leprariae TaxID=2615207 RepID=A0A7V7TYL5_9HYPH|nr:hypothetical protein [Aureimonas leprariae]KAB0682842.1 hypothetical protein F6X38_01810 [Aureimonas leprariae]